MWLWICEECGSLIQKGHNLCSFHKFKKRKNRNESNDSDWRIQYGNRGIDKRIKDD